MTRPAAALLLAAALLAPTPARPAPVADDSAAVAGDSADSALWARPALEPDESGAPVPAPRDYRAEVVANFSEANRAYSGLKTVLRLFEPLAAILFGLLVLFSGLAARMRDIAHHFGRHRWVRVLVFLALYAALGFLLGLPLAWYDSFALEHQFGLSTQAWSAWFGDQLKALVLGVVVLGVVPLAWLAYALIARARRTWWLWVGLLALPVIVGGTLLEPLVIDPLFNRFTPLRDATLERRILSLAERAGIPGRRVVEVDRSAQTRKYNAYVNGFGVSQRIVLWDTTLEGLADDEILFITGHEIGHYALGHIWKGIALSWAASLGLLAGVAGIAAWATGRWGRRWGFERLDDVASMPLLATLLTLGSFLAQPLVNGVSRGMETEADRYGLEITRDNDAAARAFLALGAQNRSNPRPAPWVRFLLYSHPTLAERVDLALDYRPWERGEPNRHFRGGAP